MMTMHNARTILSQVFGTALDSERALLGAWNICKLSGHDDKRLICAIVTYFDYYASFVDLMKWIISKEVEGMSLSEGGVPFREDTISTALLLHFGETCTECLTYLKEVIKPTVSRIKALPNPKPPATQDATAADALHPNELLCICRELINNIIHSVTTPLPWLDIVKHIMLCVHRRFPGTGMDVAAVANVFLLRFVLRALTFPEHYAVVKKVKLHTRKTLITVSKTVQKLASFDNEPVEGDKPVIPDSDPVVCAEFMRESSTKLKEFLILLARRPLGPSMQRWIPQGGLKDASKTIVYHISHHEEELRAAVPGLLPDNLSTTKSRANSVGDIDSLQSCLSNPLTRDAYSTFMKHEFSDTLLLFWIEAEKYTKNPTVEYAREIFDKYIRSGACYEVDTEQKTRSKVHDVIATGSVDRNLFQTVQTLVYAAMADDSFPRFLQSKSGTK